MTCYFGLGVNIFAGAHLLFNANWTLPICWTSQILAQKDPGTCSTSQILPQNDPNVTNPALGQSGRHLWAHGRASVRALRNNKQWFRQWICQSRNNKQCSQNEIYDIGTEILKRTRFFTKIIKSFCKSIILQEIKSAGHSPSSGSVKTSFKAIFKKWPSWIRSSRY